MNNNLGEILSIRAQDIGFDLTDDQVKKYLKYMDLLLEWNEKMNLTAITDKMEIIDKHFIDSMTCLKFSLKSDLKILDLGTGAGFPGVPIKILRDDLTVTLMDSLKKRLTFLDCVIKELNLESIETYHGRAEESAHSNLFREQYGAVYARAVARMSLLVEYCLPFVEVGGVFVSQKGQDWKEELEEAKSAIKILGAEVADVIQVMIPGRDYIRQLIVLEKVKPTEAKYPRHGSKISKKTL